MVGLEVDIGVQSHGKRACVKSGDGVGRGGLASCAWGPFVRVQQSSKPREDLSLPVLLETLCCFSYRIATG